MLVFWCDALCSNESLPSKDEQIFLIVASVISLASQDQFIIWSKGLHMTCNVTFTDNTLLISGYYHFNIILVFSSATCLHFKSGQFITISLVRFDPRIFLSALKSIWSKLNFCDSND